MVLHSGSRGIGNQLAMTHIAKAQGLMKQWFISLPDPDLAYLPQGTPEFDAYIADLLWAQAYARDRDLWITRKGAIGARAGQRGIIPGSMGTRSYVVEGLGSAASYESCSHAAGRRLSRTAAKKTLSVDPLREAMEGRAWSDEEARDLVDEHPLAYQDIDQVMEDQRDLVRPLHTLSQVLNYKGTQ